MNLYHKIKIDDPPKIEVNEQKIILYEYKKIIRLESSVIETSEYILTGESLCILQMNTHDLILGGKMKELKVKGYEEI